MLVINMLGGPGSRKSTIAMQTTAAFKWRGTKVEYVSEYAKDATWDEHHSALKDQLWVLANQQRRLTRLEGKVDVVVTDSPILLSAVYGRMYSPGLPPSFYQLCKDLYQKVERVNLYIYRPDRYDNYGRSQSKSEAMVIDDKVQEVLREWGEKVEYIKAEDDSYKIVVDWVLEKMK